MATFRSRSERNRQRPPGYVRESPEKTDPAPRSAGIARHLSPCAFWHFQSTRKASRQGMTNHATHTTPRARESIRSFLRGLSASFCLREVGAVSGDFVEVGWRSGLGAGSREVESETKKNEAGSRRRRKRGAGGRSRCVCWPQCALCGCAALKSAHLTSPQTVPATVQNNKPKSGPAIVHNRLADLP